MVVHGIQAHKDRTVMAAKRRTRERHEFCNRVAAFIDRHGLLPTGARVLVAVSGGSDSVALGRVLAELAAEDDRAYKLIVGHLNHHLRAEAAADAAFTVELAERLGLPVVSGEADVSARASQDQVSTEVAARSERYEFLAAAARRAGCGFVATGHHAGDQAETICHRIIRGTGLAGLAGMRPARPLSNNGDKRDVQLIRPLLDVTREEARGYLKELGQTWREDATNEQTDYGTRNRIRGELLPLLRERYNPQVDAALGRLGRLAGQIAPQLEALGESTLKAATVAQSPEQLTLDRCKLADAGELAACQAVRAALDHLRIPLRRIGLKQIQSVWKLIDTPHPSAGAVNLPGNFSIRLKAGRLIFRAVSPPAETDASVEIALTAEGVTELPDGATLEIASRTGGFDDLKTFLAGKSPAVEMIDADALSEPLFARRWRAGDSFRPLGGPGSMKLSDFFGSAKIPADQRGQAWIICDAKGIVWVAPYRIAHRVRVTDQTRRMVVVSVNATTKHA